MERFIAGPYRKHNNNFGYVSEDERNTPQAFSHFSYEVSSHKILVCDIQVSCRCASPSLCFEIALSHFLSLQGVGDLYTDPQIHSRDGQGFGKGNMGDKGFQKFLGAHRCNAICM